MKGAKMENKYNVKKYKGFDVYYIDEGHSFIYADFYDSEKLIDGLTDYIFDEENLLNYANRTSKIKFTGELRQFVNLYHNISVFLNQQLETLSIGDVSEELMDVLGQEYTLINEDGELKVQKDKVGKLGEYVFHLLLTDFFQLDCVLPKFRYTTDRNMSVFGIDTLFLDTKGKTIFFGESKFSKDLYNGITLVNKSLKEYEQQILEEYRIVLGPQDVFPLSQEFMDLFGEQRQICVSFNKLIEVAEITTIGVPIFIAHGNGKGRNTPVDFINQMLTKIHKKDFLGLDTKYIFISLPIIDKNRFVELAIKKAVKKQDEYEKKCR